MKGLFLSLPAKQSNPKRLIIFFNGWSLDENIVKHMTSNNYDVLMFYDYSDFEIASEILEEIKTYEEINIVAFSFGVWAFGYALCHCEALATLPTKRLNIGLERKIQIDSWIAASPSAPRNDMECFSLNQVVAINGTLIPIDDKFGISQKMFDLTLNNLSEKTYPKFFQNMFDGEADFTKMPKRTVENQKEELLAIKNNSKKQIKSFSPTKVFIGLSDKIIPVKNQIAFWEGKAQIIKKQSGHYINFESWDEIING